MRDESGAPIEAATHVPVEAESLVLAASRAAVTTLAPEELEIFDSVATEWRSRVNRGERSTPGGSVGFGIESGLVTELVMQVAAAAIGEIFSFAASRARSRWRRWRRRRTGEPGTVPAPSGTERPLDIEKPLRIEDEIRLREATQRHAIALGLSADQAGLLADAIVGALRSAVEQPPASDPPTDQSDDQPVARDVIPQPVGEEP